MRNRARDQLRENVNRLIKDGRTTHNEMVATKKISNGTLGRVRSAKGKTGTSVDTLDQLTDALAAVGFSTEPWLLLQPEGGKVVAQHSSEDEAPLSSPAKAIAREFDEFSDETKAQVMALALDLFRKCRDNPIEDVEVVVTKPDSKREQRASPSGSRAPLR